MRPLVQLETFVFMSLAAFMLAATVLLTSPDSAEAEEAAPGPSCSCPDAERKSTRPKFADYEPALDENDEIAALASVQIALSRMDDGSPYVWKRANGRLSGIVRPTRSFRADNGNLCRHVVVLLTTGYRTRTAEGVACRLAGGRWKLEG